MDIILSRFCFGSSENLFRIHTYPLLQLSFHPGLQVSIYLLLPRFSILPGPLASDSSGHPIWLLLLLVGFISCLASSQRLSPPHGPWVLCAQPATLTPPHFSITKFCQFYHKHLFNLTSLYFWPQHLSTLRVPKSLIWLGSYLSFLITVLCSTELLEINPKTNNKWKLICSLKTLAGSWWPWGWRPECVADVHVSPSEVASSTALHHIPCRVVFRYDLNLNRVFTHTALHAQNVLSVTSPLLSRCPLFWVLIKGILTGMPSPGHPTAHGQWK